MKIASVYLFCSLGAVCAAAVGSPVERVVVLLNDLHAKIEHDGKEESLVYNKYACWCEDTTSRKAGMITGAQAELRSLGQAILSLKGRVAVLSAEIAELTANIKANQEAQAEATAIREKENRAYAASITEMKEVLAALEKAITVLGKGSTNLLQATAAVRAQAVKDVVQALPSTAALKPAQLSMLEAATSAGYMPQSMTVQGILQDMYDTFSNDLEGATVTEASANMKFENLIAAKQQELLTMQASKTKKEGEKAAAEGELADTTQNYDDTESQMKADIKFFDETKAACQAKHDDWALRDSNRQEELAGIEKALEILSSDDARKLFGSTIKAGKETGASDSYKTGVSISFLQLDGDVPQLAAKQAYAALRVQAKEAHSLRLAVLAVRVGQAKVGHFDKVIQAIDQMMATVREEGAADIAKRDQCLGEYQKIDSTVADTNWLIEKNVAKIDKLESLIKLRTEQKLATIEHISGVTKEIADMTQQRTHENADFLQAKSDDQDAIKLLVEARNALSAFYEKEKIELGPIQGSVKGASFAQDDPVFEVSADQAPEARFSDKAHRKNESKGVLSILAMIIEDLNDEIKNGMKGEEAAQLDFEAWLKSAEALKADLEEKKTNLESQIAQRGEEKAEEHETMETNQGNLKAEQDYEKEIKPDCDWIIGAFDKRAQHRTAEINGLVSAKEFLAGKATLLETKRPGFDDAALAKLGFLGLKK